MKTKGGKGREGKGGFRKGVKKKNGRMTGAQQILSIMAQL